MRTRYPEWLKAALSKHAVGLLFLFPLAIGGEPPVKRIAQRITAPAHREPVDTFVVASATPLAALLAPISGASVPTDPERLPGAIRAYRGGRHEGVDFACVRGLPVRAAAAGWVLLINDEPNLPEARRDELLGDCRFLGLTPPEVLQVLHGRRVVLFHGLRGRQMLTSSYSHMSTVRDDLRPGMHVEQGEVLGRSGASGTSHAYREDGWGEVHFEIHFNGQPLGVGLRPIEAGQLYRQLLTAGVQR